MHLQHEAGQGESVLGLLNHEDKGTMLLQKNRIHSPNTAAHPLRLESSSRDNFGVEGGQGAV
jgi:hypothetical protein